MGDESEDEDSNLIPLPSVVGTAASAIGKSGPVRDLLGPASKVFGKYWGKRAVEIVARWEEQKRKNIRDHQRRVEQIVGQPVERPPTEKQFQLITDWISGAEDIPTDEEEAAALWQALLADIFEDDSDAQDKINVIKKLDAKDAKFILRAKSTRSIRPDEGEEIYVEKLVSLGILSRFSFLKADQSRFILRLALIAGFLLTIFFVMGSLPALLKSPNHNDIDLEVGIEVLKLISIIMLFVFSVSTGSRVLREYGTYKFTKMGLLIRNSGLRFYKRKLDQKSETASSNSATSRKKRKRVKKV